jgi:hypothetical protein
VDVPPQRPPRPRPRLGLAIGLIVLGIALGILSFVMVTLPLLRLVKEAPALATPGSVTLHLNKGLYKVFEPTGTVTNAVTPIHAADVNVSGPGGGGIPVSDTDPNENITRGNRRYASAAAFRASTPGDYTVRIGGAHGQALIVRSLADAVRSRVGWVAAIPIGGLCFLIGLVLLIVGIVRRSRAKRAAFSGEPPPA